MLAFRASSPPNERVSVPLLDTLERLPARLDRGLVWKFLWASSPVEISWAAEIGTMAVGTGFGTLISKGMLGKKRNEGGSDDEQTTPMGRVPFAVVEEMWTHCPLRREKEEGCEASVRRYQTLVFTSQEGSSFGPSKFYLLSVRGKTIRSSPITTILHTHFLGLFSRMSLITFVLNSIRLVCLISKPEPKGHSTLVPVNCCMRSA